MLCVLAFAMLGVPTLLLVLPYLRLAVTQPLLWIGVGAVAGEAAAGPHPVDAGSESKTRTEYLQCGLAFVLCWLGGFFYYASLPDIAAVLTSHGDGEPILLLSGISLWPSLAIRLMAIALCIKFIGIVIRKLDENLTSVAKEFGLLEPAYAADGIVEAVAQTWGAVADVIIKAKKPRDIWGYVVKVLSRPLLSEPSSGGDDEVDKFWNAYRSYGSTPARLCRIGVIALACVFVQLLLYVVTGEWPQKFGRGDLVQNTGYIIFWAETVLLWILVIYVADATLVCLRFVREMQGFRSKWPGQANYEPVSEWKDIDFVGKRTDCISWLILYPFLILTLLILAQSPLLDDMPRDWPRLIEMGAAFGVILLCAVMLPIEAKKLRDIALDRLSQDKSAPHQGDPNYEPQKIDSLIHTIENYETGAFTPLPQQPMVKALLFPLSGIGGTALLQYFALPGL
jgi:hypothetical protein